jgi:hypothetical protein
MIPSFGRLLRDMRVRLTAAETHKLMLAMPVILEGSIPEVSDGATCWS